MAPSVKPKVHICLVVSANMSQAEQPRDETALGYELDTITLRDIAAVRYVRHHEWLDQVIGSALPTSRIKEPRIESPIDEKQLNAELGRVKAELTALKESKASGWNFEVNSDKALLLNDEIARLRDDFGTSVPDESIKRVEKALNVKIVPLSSINPVEVTYNREKETHQANQAAEPDGALDPGSPEPSDTSKTPAVNDDADVVMDTM